MTGPRPTATRQMSAVTVVLVPSASYVTVASVSLDDDRRDGRAGGGRDPALAERARDLLGEILVLERREPGERLDHRDLGAERAVDRRELEAHRAGADHDGRRRDAVGAQRLVARDDACARPPARAGAGARDPVASDDVGRRRPRARRPRATGPGRAWRCRSAPRSRAFTRPVTPLTSLSTIASSNAWTADQSGSPDALMPHSDDAFDGVHHRGRLQQRLRRDAAAEQAGAAEAIVALDDRDALAQLRGTQGGGVPAGPGADHDYVVAGRPSGTQVYRRWPLRPRAASAPAA